MPYLGTSLLIGLGTVALTLLLAAPAGFALAKLRPLGGGALGLFLLVAQMIPGIVMAMGFYGIFLDLPHRQDGAALRRARSHSAQGCHPSPGSKTPGNPAGRSPSRLRTALGKSPSPPQESR
ncbi:hypothetical protein AQJ64_16035 [Streptomyces griseoruber]|uniref:Uncharacterized protein n=1 Tax=Streptomyces griseoruber TaxID=1943 RepID=A0A101T1V6_9ACTN|nr:hypothetical protein AQJ64_16035 [Streptomyces griseoruber]